jgi:GT2 family glycosyltransferase
MKLSNQKFVKLNFNGSFESKRYFNRIFADKPVRGDCMNIPTTNIVVSVVIPTVNQVDLVKQCLNSFFDSNPSSIYPYEVIVVDDGSSPEIQHRLREAISVYPVQLITQPQNSGFSKTVNRGAAAARGRYICLLNNDVTFIQKNWLDIMMSDSHRVKAGIIGPRLLYPNGTIQHGGIIYTPATGGFDHEYRHQPGNYPPALKTREVLGVTGALMLINRELWNLLGGMDERFFVGMEDIDFSLRAWEEGWRIYFSGAAVAVHPEGFTRGNDTYWRNKGLESGHQFYLKWHRKLLAMNTKHLPANGQTRPLSLSEFQASQWRKIISRRTRPVYSTTTHFSSSSSGSPRSTHVPPVYKSK